MMMVFTGASSTKASNILQFEKVLLIPSVLYCLVALFVYLKQSKGLRELWLRIPAYLIFTLCIINSLTISGFLSFYLVQVKLGQAPEIFQLIPLFVGISSSIGLLLSFSFLKRNKPFSSYMDRLQAREEIFTQKN